MNWQIKYAIIKPEGTKVKYGIANFTKRVLTINELIEPVRKLIATIHEALHVFFGPSPTELGHYKLHIMAIIFQDVLSRMSDWRKIKFPVDIQPRHDGFYHIVKGSNYKGLDQLLIAMIRQKLSNAKIALGESEVQSILDNTRAILEAKDGDVVNFKINTGGNTNAGI